MNNMLHTIKEQEDNSNIDVEERNNQLFNQEALNNYKNIEYQDQEIRAGRCISQQINQIG